MGGEGESQSPKINTDIWKHLKIRWLVFRSWLNIPIFFIPVLAYFYVPSLSKDLYVEILPSCKEWCPLCRILPTPGTSTNRQGNSVPRFQVLGIWIAPSPYKIPYARFRGVNLFWVRRFPITRVWILSTVPPVGFQNFTPPSPSISSVRDWHAVRGRGTSFD